MYTFGPFSQQVGDFRNCQQVALSCLGLTLADQSLRDEMHRIGENALYVPLQETHKNSI